MGVVAVVVVVVWAPGLRLRDKRWVGTWCVGVGAKTDRGIDLGIIRLI